MKTWKHRTLIAIAVIFGMAVAFTACTDEPDNNGPQTPKTVEDTFTIKDLPTEGDPAKYANLSQNGKVTIVYPASFTQARMAAIKVKIIGTLPGLNERAGNSSDFKAKIKAILDRGLTITIEETKSITYYMKAVDNQLMIETAYIEHTDVDGGIIANTLIGIINSGNLAQATPAHAPAQYLTMHIETKEKATQRT